MSASRGAKLFFGVTGLVGGSYFMYKVAYPYTRCIYMSLTKQDEATAFEVAKMEKAFRRLQEAENCHSLLKKHLTRKVLDKLKYKKTTIGATLYDIIKSGAENLDDEVGVYAADVQSYLMFAPLLDPIIEDYHTGFSPSKDKQPNVDLGEGREKSDFPELDPSGEFIKSTRIRCARTIKGYPFNPLLTGDDYMIMQEKSKMILSALKDDLQGEYYPLAKMTPEVQQRLINDHFLFKEGDRYLKAANAYNYWPLGRGIFHNAAKTFLVWVNEEDHLRLISMQAGSNVGEVLERLNRALRQIDAQKLIFSRDERLGWLTFCPTNLGSTVRASVHIKLPKLAAREDFKEICSRLNLQVRGIDGEHSKGQNGVYDISNKRRLGISEYQAVKEMYDGVKELIEMEKGEGEARGR